VPPQHLRSLLTQGPSNLGRYEEERLRELRADLDRRRENLGELFSNHQCSSEGSGIKTSIPYPPPELEDKRMKERWAQEDAERDAKLRAVQAKRERMVRLDEALRSQVIRIWGRRVHHPARSSMMTGSVPAMAV
jgi:hypothetical protein